MDVPTLSEQERRFYWEMFRSFDAEGREQLPGAHIFDVFLTSGLPPELLNQIVDLCGAKRLGYFGRSEFFIALKLIAAAQNGCPPVLDICTSGIELPLPRFHLPQRNAEPYWGQPVAHSAFTQQIPADQHFIYYDRGIQAAVAQHDPAAALRIYQPGRSMSLVGSITGDSQTQERSSSPPVSADRGDVLSARKSSAPAVHLVHPASPAGHQVGHSEERKTDKGWAMFEDDNQAGMLKPDCKDWTQFTDTSKADTSSVSSESVDDVWCITDEQRDYYTRQFKLMQEDIRGVISGAVAKEFFEKSKLPVHELSTIWQLSDFNRDGALSLDEFCTAMHLVVLRRNDIELPETLPPVLQPYAPVITNDEPFAADMPAGSTLKKMSPTPSTSSQPWTTAFQLPESPTSSSVSSPGNKPTPVNFEFRPITVDSDSKIVHPLAVRLSPESQPFSDVMTSSGYSGHDASGGTVGNATGGEMMVSPASTAQNTVATDLLIDLGPSDEPQLQYQATAGAHLVHRPRPTPKKAQSLSGPTQDVMMHVMLPPPPVTQDNAYPSGDRVLPDSAPVPPPRASMSGHSRSSSLDNQLIHFNAAGGESRKVVFPPAVPRRSSPKDFAAHGDADYGQAVADSKLIGSPTSSGPDRLSPSNDVDTAFKMSRRNASKLNSLERRDLKAKIHRQKERNQVLSRLNSELNQELQEVMEQHIALEIQMEHLRSFYS